MFWKELEFYCENYEKNVKQIISITILSFREALNSALCFKDVLSCSADKSFVLYCFIKQLNFFHNFQYNDHTGKLNILVLWTQTGKSNMDFATPVYFVYDYTWFIKVIQKSCKSP